MRAYIGEEHPWDATPCMECVGMFGVLASHERTLMGGNGVLVGLDSAGSGAFGGLGDSEGEVGCGDDFNEVHEVE